MFESLLETLKSYSLVGPVLVAAPIALFIAFYFNWWRNRKSLSFEVLTSTSLFSVNADVKHRVEVTLDGKPVKNVQLVIIEIQNDGFLSIEDKDFATPIKIDFGENSEIISVENKENFPDDLPVKFTQENSKIEIESLLLNRKDSLKIQILLNKFENVINISARIKGVQKIRNSAISSNFFSYSTKHLKMDVFFSLFLIPLIIWLNLLAIQKSDFFTFGISLLLFSLCVSLIVAEYYAYRKTRKNK